MNRWLNIGFAWISVFLTVLLSIIYVLRLAIKSGKLGKLTNAINRVLRKYHKPLGVLLILTGLFHGLFSSQKVWSLNLGTVSWVVSILLGINWMVRKHLSKLKGWMHYHRVLTVLFIATIVWHVIDVGGIQVFNLLGGSTLKSGSSVKVDPSLITTSQNLQLKDGTYEGEATGYQPGLKVSVDIKDNKIVGITILEHHEVNARFYSTPIEVIPQEIIDAQATDVDTVSGATFTSIGIINAVNNALSKALISGELPQDKSLPQNRGHGGHHGFREGDSGALPGFGN
ncbi:MAG: FMN-binding protein [Clostridia bacterium]|nr:FMN-binding protein [Clostridia bacterium]